MPRSTPTDAELAALVSRAKASSPDPRVQDNHLFRLLFDREHGAYDARGMRTREWIERYFRIRDRAGKIVPLVLNSSQRRLLAMIYRMERAGLPVRIQILKARKDGISTFIGAFATERGLRSEYFRSLIVAHKKDSSKVLLEMVNIGRRKMPKRGDSPWDFAMRSEAKQSLEWDAPLHTEITITSAETDNPARGMTPTLVHASESAFYPKAEQIAASIFAALPSRPGTYGFDESTANGASGKFHDDFWAAWKERDLPLTERTQPWVAMFFPWWSQDELRYSRTYGAGRQMSDSQYQEIVKSRDAEEDWVLRQKYLRRWRPDDEWEEVTFSESTELTINRNGKIVGTWRDCTQGRKKWRRKLAGWNKVDVDQLLWRRWKLSDKEFGSVESDRKALFNQEYPSRPEVAFTSTGAPIFNLSELVRRLDEAAPPVFRGLLVAPGAQVTTADRIVADAAPD